jgi:hypothetical protein
MPSKKILQLKDKTDQHTIEKDPFNMPFRLIISAGSGLGKTNLLCNLLLRDCFYNKEIDGDNIYIFSGSLSENKIQILIEQKDIPRTNLFNDYDEGALEVIYDMIVDDYNNAIEDKKKPVQSCIILDDLGFKNLFAKSRKNNMVDKLFTNGRKYNINTILVLQRWTMASTNVRSNCSGAIVGKMTNKELYLLETDMNYLEDKKKFFKMVRDNTEDKHDFMVFNLSKKDIYQDKNFETINIV